MLVSIVIINFNTFQLTCDCIKSVFNHVDGNSYEIILVDNASTECDADQFLSVFPGIKLIKSPINLGFAKGNNLGIQHSKGDIILLLNSDTYLTEDCISRTARLYDSMPNLGAVSVKIVYPEGYFQKTARRFRSIRNELLDLFRPVLYILPYKKRATLMLNQYFKGDFSVESDWVSGAFMMFRREILNRLPEQKLDERFFMYGEDQLWCYQFSQQGFINYFFHEVSVVHIANASTSPSKRLKLLHLFLNRELEIMAYRKGKGVYYYTFKAIFTFKEMTRYFIKVAALKLFNYKLK